MEHQDKCIRFDWAAKRLLRNKAYFGVQEGFLTVSPKRRQKEELKLSWK